MAGKFVTDLELHLIGEDDCIWCLDSPLIYDSDIVGRVLVPPGFQTDLASVPRIPLLYLCWGGKAHREGVLHDYLYRIDSRPSVTKKTADSVFLEAMTARKKPPWVRFPMYWGVCLGGAGSYHKKKVEDKLT